MIIRLFTTLTFILFSLGCNAETKVVAAATSSPESAVTSFSAAVSNKDVGLFRSITKPSGIYLVRLFTSGNLGSRGPELSELVNPSIINEKLQFPIKGQTPFGLKMNFSELPIKSYQALSQHTLPAEIDTTHYDQWTPLLQKALSNTPEAANYSPTLLKSSSGKYWVYAEAQIIDGMLVGAFAVFSPEGDKFKLVAIIELL